jgi:hypothetical protein
VQILTAMFFSLSYCTGVPILLVFAFAFFVVLYWVDKYLFCRVYQTPPQYVPLQTVSHPWFSCC